jgi:hypothetical protein
MVCGYDFTIVGDLCRPRATRRSATEIATQPASPFQSGEVPDQSWWEPATGELPLTQGDRIRKAGDSRKRIFCFPKRTNRSRENSQDTMSQVDRQTWPKLNCHKWFKLSERSSGA